MTAHHLGFTGTQRGATTAQLLTLVTILSEPGHELYPANSIHVGDCVGADEQAALIARAFGVYVVGHPPSDPGRRANFPHYRFSYAPKPYLERNRELVDVSNALVACPRTLDEELRSGTWATIRYALSQGVPTYLIDPETGKLRRQHVKRKHT